MSIFETMLQQQLDPTYQMHQKLADGIYEKQNAEVTSSKLQTADAILERLDKCTEHTDRTYVATLHALLIGLQGKR